MKKKYELRFFGKEMGCYLEYWLKRVLRDLFLLIISYKVVGEI